MDQNKNSNYSPENKDSPKGQYSTYVVPDNKKSPLLESVNSTKIGVIWTLKHEIISPKLYEILINI